MSRSSGCELYLQEIGVRQKIVLHYLIHDLYRHMSTKTLQELSIIISRTSDNKDKVMDR